MASAVTTLGALVVAVAACACGKGAGPTPPAPNGIDHGGVIAYVRQSLTAGEPAIYTIFEDGTGNRQVVTTAIGLNHHDWSPDGQRLVAVGYVALDTWSLYVFSADGLGLFTRLTATDSARDSEPAWSPDGTRIAFTRIWPYQGDREEIWMMNADGSGQRFTGLLGLAPEWSPSGSRLVYSSRVSGNSEIYTANPDGTDERRLTNSPAGEWYPAWSPDGTRIAFALAGVTSPADGSRWEIHVMGADGSSVTRLTDNDALDNYPKWSPDGRRISFTSDRHEPGDAEIYVMNADGSGARRVTTLPPGVMANNAVWRPATAP